MHQHGINVAALVKSLSYKKAAMETSHQLSGRMPFVTISRMAGSGGRRVAQKLVELLNERAPNPKSMLSGWQWCDKELCRRVTEDPKLKVSIEELLNENYSSVLDDLMSEIITGHTHQDLVVNRVFKIMLDFAAAGRVVLVGRGGACLTQSFPYGIHFRILASRRKRLYNMQRFLNMNEREAEAEMTRRESEQEQLVRRHFKRNINDPLLYDAVFSKDDLTTDEIAEAMLAIVASKLKKFEAGEPWTHRLDPFRKELEG
ncbi:cytidylate kinase-like family protein [Candidatus Sumerlaeota bacterium]|nr:cytidylate kinase-like family protein [Candidatus Sumerlaeota bacterium]